MTQSTFLMADIRMPEFVPFGASWMSRDLTLARGEKKYF